MEFLIFALVLILIPIFNNRALLITFTGLVLIIAVKVCFNTGFDFYEHFIGKTPLSEQFFQHHAVRGEWNILLNLLGLLSGFEILAKLFQETNIPVKLVKYLPSDWKGPFILLFFVFVLSTFLDNIAAALIGGAMAAIVFKHKVHIGYLASIVAASNAGGSGSVIGDTTTTMMWIAGISPFQILHAFIASGIAFIIFGFIASFQQNKYQPVQKQSEMSHVSYLMSPVSVKIDFGKLLIVILVLVSAIVTNILIDMPFIGVWLIIIIASVFKRIPWKEATKSMNGTIFLLCLVSAASLMPLKSLPLPSWKSVFMIGFISSVFNNIPLTKLCIEQGHYDWGMLAYAIGFGGSILWFGSSAGVAIINEFPEAKNVTLWLRKSWYILLSYIIGFVALNIIMGWSN